MKEINTYIIEKLKLNKDSITEKDLGNNLNGREAANLVEKTFSDEKSFEDMVNDYLEEWFILNYKAHHDEPIENNFTKQIDSIKEVIFDSLKRNNVHNTIWMKCPIGFIKYIAKNYCK